MRKILVTGHKGYIGSHLVWYLRQHLPKATIHGYDWASHYDRPGSFGVKKLIDRDFTELTFHGMTHNIEPYDVIFHLAAESNVSVFNENPIMAVQNTIDAMSVVKIPHKKFIFASSASVMPNVSLYARTKFLCEQMVTKLSPNYIIMRLHNVAGAIPESGFYEFHKPETHLIPNLILEDTVTIHGDGSQIRDYVHVVDVCKAMFNVSFNLFDPYELSSHWKNSLFEFGTTKGYSVIDMIQIYQEISGKKVNVQFGEPRDGDVKELVAQNVFLPTESIRKTIKDAILAYKKAGLLTI